MITASLTACLPTHCTHDTGVCGKAPSFHVSLCPAILQQKLLSSPRFGVLKANISSCHPLRRVFFSETPVSTLRGRGLPGDNNICVYTYVYIYIYIYVYIYIYTHMCIYIYIYTQTYIHTYVRTYIHTYVRTYIHIYKQGHDTETLPNKMLRALEGSASRFSHRSTGNVRTKEATRASNNRLPSIHGSFLIALVSNCAHFELVPELDMTRGKPTPG